MSGKVVRSIALNPGDHAVHLHRSFAEQKEVLLAFFRDGLENCEHCVYITSDVSADDWFFEFQAYGVDVQREREKGALQIVHRDEWRSPEGFSSIAQARKTLAYIDRAMGTNGLRIAGDAAWALRPELPIDLLCHWEATANLIYERQPIRVICQYDLDAHSPDGIRAALRTHPVVILEGHRCENPFYEAPVILEYEPLLSDSCADPEQIERMLARLRSQF